MKAIAVALTVGVMMTVEQRDTHQSTFDDASAAVSAHGRFVAFTTYSPLVRADTNEWSDVYVLDREQQRVTLESEDSRELQGDISHPGISGDGRFVVFERASAIVVRDRNAGVTRILRDARQPSISEDGRTVVFIAGALTGLAVMDVNGDRTDIYAANLELSDPRRLSLGMKGIDPSLAASVHPAASSDGRFIAFTSRLQPDGERPREPMVFVRDTLRQSTRFVAAGWDPSISGNGRFVALTGPANRHTHIFLADLHTGDVRAITNSTRHGFANGSSAKPKISSDGRFIAFQSEASDLVASDDFNLLWDVFVFDRLTGKTRLVSGGADGAWMEPSGGPSIDGSGSVIAFSSRHPTNASDKSNDFDLYLFARRAKK